MKNAIIEIFGRDMLKLRDEILAYSDEKKLWITAPGISNSAGNLSLHLLGNLDHFVGGVLGKNGYQRKRDEEFSAKDIPATDLVAMILRTRDTVINTLEGIAEPAFAMDYPEMKHDKVLRTDFMLLHLLAHFNYHLGQINYHRRLLAN